MADDIVATLILRAVDQASTQIKAVGDQVALTDAKVRASSETTTVAAGASWTKMGLVAGAAAVVVGGASIGMAAKFQSSMELIRTQAGASQAEVDRMSGAVLKMAADVGTGPDQLAAGLYHIESAGIRGAQALKVEQAAAEGAKVGHADLESVTNALIAVSKSHVTGIHGEIDAMGQLNAVVGAGNMRMNDLAAAMSTGILARAASVGVSFRDIGAALATMTTQGIPAQAAATRLQMTLSLMEAPAKKAKDALASIGVTSTQLANDMRSHGLVFALQDLEKHLKESGKTATEQAQIISAAFGGGRTSGAVLTLLQNLDQVKAKYKEIGATASQFGSDWAATERTASEQFDKVKASVQVIAIEIGQALLPAMEKVLQTVTPIVTKMADWAQSHKDVVAGILAVAGAVGALAGTMIIIGKIEALIAATKLWTAAQWLLNAALDANPIGLVIIAIGLLVAAFIVAYTHSENFRQIVQKVLSRLQDLAAFIQSNVIPAVQDLADFIETKVVGTFRLFMDIAGQAGEKLDGLAKMLGISKGDFLALIPVIGPVIFAFEHVGQIVKMVGDLISWLSGIIGRFIAALASAASNVPILGGLFGALIDPIKQTALAFEALGAKIDSYAKSASDADPVTSHLSTKLRALEQTANDMGTTVQHAAKKVADSVHDADPVHHTAVQHMISDAEKLGLVWTNTGNQIAKAVGMIGGPLAVGSPTQVKASAGKAGFGGSGPVALPSEPGGQGSSEFGKATVVLPPNPSFEGRPPLDQAPSKTFTTMTQYVQALVSAFSSQQQNETALFTATQQVIAEQGSAEVDQLKAVDSAIQAETAVIQAQAGVTLARGEATLAAVRDQGGIIQAQGALAQATDAAGRQVARDQLRIATETYQMDQQQARLDEVIATGQLKIALDRQAADAAASAYTRVIDQDKIALALAELKLTVAQNQLATDQLTVQGDIARLLGSGNDYSQMIKGDLGGIASAQQQVQNLTARMQADQQAASLAAGQWAIKISQDEQQLAIDQENKAQNSQAWQIQIARDNNQLQVDQLAAQNTTNSKIATTNSLLGMSLSEMQQWFSPMLDAMRNLRSGVGHNWVGSGPDPFEQFINSAPSAFASNPTA